MSVDQYKCKCRGVSLIISQFYCKGEGWQAHFVRVLWLQRDIKTWCSLLCVIYVIDMTTTVRLTKGKVSDEQALW